MRVFIHLANTEGPPGFQAGASVKGLIPGVTRLSETARELVSPPMRQC